MRPELTANSLPVLAKTMAALQSIMDSSGMNVSFFARVAFIDSIKQDSWARVSMLLSAGIALAMLRPLAQNLETH